MIWIIAELLHGKPYAIMLTPYWNASVRLGFFIFIVLLQHSLKSEQLRAKIDPLTKIGNRRHFFQVASLEIERLRRYTRPVTVVYIDLDNFKTVNDTRGHKTGDLLLQTVAQTLKGNIRSSDTAARIGGDEFVLLLPETDAMAARDFVTKLNRQLLQAMKMKNWPVSFSMGVMTFVTPPDSVDNMIIRADSLMYSAKKDGKNTIRYDIFQAVKSSQDSDEVYKRSKRTCS